MREVPGQPALAGNVPRISAPIRYVGERQKSRGVADAMSATPQKTGRARGGGNGRPVALTIRHGAFGSGRFRGAKAVGLRQKNRSAAEQTFEPNRGSARQMTSSRHWVGVVEPPRQPRVRSAAGDRGLQARRVDWWHRRSRLLFGGASVAIAMLSFVAGLEVQFALARPSLERPGLDPSPSTVP